MKLKSKCLFCMKHHKVVPTMCAAKGRVMDLYLKEGIEMWRLFRAIHNGHVNLDREAARLIKWEKQNTL